MYDNAPAPFHSPKRRISGTVTPAIANAGLAGPYIVAFSASCTCKRRRCHRNMLQANVAIGISGNYFCPNSVHLSFCSRPPILCTAHVALDPRVSHSHSRHSIEPPRRFLLQALPSLAKAVRIHVHHCTVSVCGSLRNSSGTPTSRGNVSDCILFKKTQPIAEIRLIQSIRQQHDPLCRVRIKEVLAHFPDHVHRQRNLLGLDELTRAVTISFPCLTKTLKHTCASFSKLKSLI